MASGVINFTNSNSSMGQIKKTSTTAIQQDMEDAVLKTCEKSELPEYASDTVLIYTRDTGQIYAGRGRGQNLLDMSDVIIINDFGYLPSTGVNNKLYISKSQYGLAYYDESKQDYTYLTLNDASASVIATACILEYVKPNAFPTTGASGKLYLTQDNKLYRWDSTNGKYALVSDQASFEKVLAVIDKVGDYEKILDSIADLEKFKADAVDLENYRLKSNKISLVDLDDDVLNEINANNSVGTEYNDSELRRLITALQNDKADKTDLNNYRRTDVKIKETDLSADLRAKVNQAYDDTGVKNDIALLKSSKLDTVTANTMYRKVSDSITISDLAQDVIDAINNSASSAPSYDDTDVKNDINSIKSDITDLQNDKADKTDLDDYRLKRDSIGFSDLTTDLKDAINASSTPFDDTDLKNEDLRLENDKLDKSAFQAYTTSLSTTLQDFRSKSDKITESDLDTALADKINNSSGNSTPYDDTFLQDEVARLENDKLDKSEFQNYTTSLSTTLQNFRDKNDKITETDLDSDLIDKINNASYNDTDIKNDLDSLKNSLDDYRSKNDKITWSDLDSTLQNTITTAADKSSLVQEDERLENDKADKTDLNDLADVVDSLTSQLEAALNRIDALENASSNSGTEQPEPEETPSTGDSANELKPFCYTFALNGAGESEIALNTLSDYDADNPISINDFYGITDEDETYDSSRQKVIVTFLGYGLTSDNSTTITNPQNEIMPVSIEGRVATISPDGYVDYDSDTTILSFRNATVGKRIYQISTVS